MSNGFIPATMEKIYNLGTDVPPRLFRRAVEDKLSYAELRPYVDFANLP